MVRNDAIGPFHLNMMCGVCHAASQLSLLQGICKSCWRKMPLVHNPERDTVHMVIVADGKPYVLASLKYSEMTWFKCFGIISWTTAEALKSNKLKTVQDIIKKGYTKKQLSNLPRIGKVALKQIEELFSLIGEKLKPRSKFPKICAAAVIIDRKSITYPVELPEISKK